MRRYLAYFATVFLFATAATAAPSADQAKSYVDNVASQAVSIIKDAQGGKAANGAAKQKFRSILNNSFDVPTIAKFTVGKYWRQASAAEQQQIIDLIKTTILDKYADTLLESSGNKYDLGAATARENGDFEVGMTGYNKDNTPIAFSWRLRPAGNFFKVIDISVEGVSMSFTHRSDFASVIERNGGKVQALISALQNREFSKK